MIKKYKTAKRKERTKIKENYIRKVLQEKEMSQQELADLCLNGDKQTLSKIILGKKKCISLPTAITISQALGVPVESLFVIETNK
jgi:DNA-binding XRE family transcriptional regulator